MHLYCMMDTVMDHPDSISVKDSLSQLRGAVSKKPSGASASSGTASGLRELLYPSLHVSEGSPHPVINQHKCMTSHCNPTWN